MEAFIDIVNHLTGAQIWLIVAASVFAICAVMMFVIFWQFNKHQDDIRASGPAHEPEAMLVDLNKQTDRERYALSDKPTMIGRIPANDIDRYDSVVIADVTIGRRHAVLDFHDNAFWIQDQGSVNGTYVNGHRIEGERRLQDGDEIKVHKFSFQFVDRNHARLDNTGHFDWPDPVENLVMSPNRVLAGHGDTMLDIPRFSIEKRQNQLRTQVLDQQDFEQAVVQPSQLKKNTDHEIREHIRDVTIRLVTNQDGDKTTRLYSDLLDGPPINRPNFNVVPVGGTRDEKIVESDPFDDKLVDSDQTFKNKNPFKEVDAIPDINEKVIEALDDFFNDTSDNLPDVNQLELTNKGDRLAQMGGYDNNASGKLKRAGNGKLHKDNDD